MLGGLIMYTTRNNPLPKKMRFHFNFRGKAKMPFERKQDAQLYINAKHLTDYTIYLCNYCNKYHISHKKGDSE